MLIGYGRVATAEQEPERQVGALARAGVDPENIHIDIAGGARSTRPKLDRVLKFARAGDTLVVTRLDRLGRSVPHLVELGASLRSRDIGLRVLEQGIDTGTAQGRAMFGMFTVLEQLRRDLAVANTQEGLAVARAGGRRGGRPPKVTPEQARTAQRLYDEGGHTVAEIAQLLGVKRGTLYGHLDKSTVGNRPRARKPTPPPVRSVQQGDSVTSADSPNADASNEPGGQPRAAGGGTGEAPQAPGAPTTADPSATGSEPGPATTGSVPESATARPRASSSTGTGPGSARPRLVDSSRSAERGSSPARRIAVIPGAAAPAHPDAAPEPSPRPARTLPAAAPNRRAGRTVCPNCGYRPSHFRDRIRQRQDLALIWLYPDPDHPGRIVERRHCAECQPHEQVASVECAHCADGPLLTGPYASAPYGLPEPVRRWLTARGWHIDGSRWTCAKHTQPD